MGGRGGGSEQAWRHGQAVRMNASGIPNARVSRNTAMRFFLLHTFGDGIGILDALGLDPALRHGESFPPPLHLALPCPALSYPCLRRRLCLVLPCPGPNKPLAGATTPNHTRLGLPEWHRRRNYDAGLRGKRAAQHGISPSSILPSSPPALLPIRPAVSILFPS